VTVAGDREPEVAAAGRAVLEDRLATIRCMTPSGASTSRIAASTPANACAHSPATRQLSAHRPCLSAFRAERAFPAWLTGPRDLAPLRRLAAARAGLR
jgi:hypothetical protein